MGIEQMLAAVLLLCWVLCIIYMWKETPQIQRSMKAFISAIMGGTVLLIAVFLVVGLLFVFVHTLIYGN